MFQSDGKCIVMVVNLHVRSMDSSNHFSPKPLFSNLQSLTDWTLLESVFSSWHELERDLGVSVHASCVLSLSLLFTLAPSLSFSSSLVISFLSLSQSLSVLSPALPSSLYHFLSFSVSLSVSWSLSVCLSVCMSVCL